MSLNTIDVRKEYQKNKDLKESDVKMFQDWLDKQPHLPKVTELQAILFLQSCYFRHEAAKVAIDNFFTVKTLCPDMLGSRNPFKSPLMDTMNVSVFSALPKQTPEGYTILFVRILDLTVDKFVYVDNIRCFDVVTMLHLYQEGTSNGHVIVLDMVGLTFSHFTRLSPLVMKKFFFYLQEAMPLRLQGLHFVNIPSWMDKLMALMKPFLKKELLQVLYLHNTVDDLVKVIPQECLPKDYGGTVEETAVLQEKMRTRLRENLALFEWEEKQKVEESLRPGKPKNIDTMFGVEGTFKKLEID